MNKFRIALAQINSVVGDLSGNSKKIVDYIDRAVDSDCDMVVFPELAITGYPPEDLIFRNSFVKANMEKMNDIVKSRSDIIIVVGFIDSNEKIYNAVSISHGSEIVDVYHKIYLPNYGVFDEDRYFTPGSKISVINLNNLNFAVNICEDIWYEDGPAKIQKKSGADLIVNISASPFHYGKYMDRRNMLSQRAIENDAYVVFCNNVGGQDELIFDGGSSIISPNGSLISGAPQFEEALLISDLDISKFNDKNRIKVFPKNEIEEINDSPINISKIDLDINFKIKNQEIRPSRPKYMSHVEEVYKALILGTKDYVSKSGFEKVVVALSGGIDSSLVATIAVDALGSENVIGISMPSMYSSQGSVIDAVKLSENLKIKLIKIPIKDIFNVFMNDLSDLIPSDSQGVAKENLQSRIRGNLVMALSNEFGWLALTTGNKSEMAVGYATIYGDMAGGYAVIKDVPKTMVFKLSKYRNIIEKSSIIPSEIISKPPSAELRPDQKDEDTLPPYDLLDIILKAYVEDDLDYYGILRLGFDDEIVRDVINLVDKSEYKRRQSPPGIKITPKNFGRDRRLPIVNKYREF